MDFYYENGPCLTFIHLILYKFGYPILWHMLELIRGLDWYNPDFCGNHHNHNSEKVWQFGMALAYRKKNTEQCVDVFEISR